MPPPPPLEKKLTCAADEYKRPGNYVWSHGKKWLWARAQCIKKGSTWREGCRWQAGKWAMASDGKAHYTMGKRICPAAGDKGRASAPTTPKAASAPPPTKASGPAPILAVFDIEVTDIRLKKNFTNSLADFVAMRLTETKAYQVVPRSQLKKRLIESKRDSFKECYDQSCQIEVGKELAAEKTLATKISKLGSQCLVSLGVFDLRRATAARAATHVGPCTEDGLFASVEKAIAKLTAGR